MARYKHPSESLDTGHDGEVLTPAASKELLLTLRPAFVLSGHTHALCRHTHKWQREDGTAESVEEVTVTSLAPALPPISLLYRVTLQSPVVAFAHGVA